MQLDAEEDENAFYKPPVEPAARKDVSNSEDSQDSQAAPILTTQEEDDD